MARNAVICAGCGTPITATQLRFRFMFSYDVYHQGTVQAVLCVGCGKPALDALKERKKAIEARKKAHASPWHEARKRERTPK